MDHATATLLELVGDTIVLKTIKSNWNSDKEKSIRRKGESHLHNKEQQATHKYFQTLGDEISAYDQVLLFGNTDAKSEFFNFLTSDNHFANIRIQVKNSDALTENQQIAFANNYFSPKT